MSMLRQLLAYGLRIAQTVLPIVAIVISLYSVHIASQARDDVRAIAGLDVRPVLKLDAEFRRIKDTAPHFTVTNDGPVDALQLEIQPKSHRYSRKDRDLQISTYDTSRRRLIRKLPPLSTVSFPFSDHWLNVNARLAEPPEHNIMEIRLSYRRPSDMHQYVESAFYFVNPDGQWAKENSASLKLAIYGPIKEAALRFANRIPRIDASDKLHPIQTTK